MLRHDTKRSMIHKKKERIELSNFMKIIYSCSVKDTIKGMKRQITEWEKKFIYSTMDLYLEYIMYSQNSMVINGLIR